MKILLLCTSFNSLTQAIFTVLKDKDYKVSLAYAITKSQMKKEIKTFAPDIILSPFCKRYLPKSIYENYPVYILHPGPRGDRGPNALEYGLRKSRWAIVWFRANKEYDSGDIFVQVDFIVRTTYKASLYRQEIKRATIKSLDTLLKNIKNNKSIPQILNPLHQQITQKQRSINWQKDSSDTIIKKIHQSDSYPGVKDEVLGIECYLFGAHKEDRLKGDPKEILAKRNGAICIGSIDGSVWITHLKEPNRFKLPSTYVLKEKLKGVKEDRLPLIFDKSYATFYEISVDIREKIAYLSFNFHNGAMSSDQCIRLKYTIEYLKKECEVLVLCGGIDFFSNGINLNILEDSQKQGEDGWSNINAINDVIASIIYADEIVTVASLSKSAGAGGVFLALACDFVVACKGVVLNPHYKTLGLSGSEYHSYTLPKRVGEKLAKTLLYNCLPISTNYAKSINMIDLLISDENYNKKLHEFTTKLYSDNFIEQKQKILEENRNHIESLKEKELVKIYPEFWDKDSSFHCLRREFVYKICPTKTPKRLQYA